MTGSNPHFMLRRKMDWSLILTLIGMVGTLAFYSVKAVQAHAQWMDQVKQAVSIIPKVEKHETEIAVLTDAVGDMRDDVKYIRRHMK